MSATQTPLDELRQDMARNHMISSGSSKAEIMGLVPNPRTEPWLWRWDDLYGIAERAGELVPVERGDRRAIALSNPGQDGMPYATSTLWAAVQRLNGRERPRTGTPRRPSVHHRRRRLLQHGRGRQGLPRARRPRADAALDVAYHRQRVRRAGRSGRRAHIPLNNFLDAELLRELPARQPARRQLPARCSSTGRPGPGEPPSTSYSPIKAYTERALENLARSPRTRSTTSRWCTRTRTPGAR